MDFDAGSDSMLAMGSYAVMPGCTLYMYMDENFSGQMCVNILIKTRRSILGSDGMTKSDCSLSAF